MRPGRRGRARRRGRRRASGGCSPCEGDRADAGVCDQRCAGCGAASVHDAQHARRKPRFLKDLAEQECGHRCDLGRLADRGASRGERGGDLPREEIERQVPRRDERTYAGGLAERVVQRGAVGLVQVAAGVQDGGGEEAEVRRGSGDVHAARQRKRLAGVDRLRARQTIEVGVDQVGHAQQDARALRGGRARPGRECSLRRGDGGVDVRVLGVRQRRVDLARRRLDALERAPRHRREESTIDEVADLLHRGLQMVLVRPPSTAMLCPET